MAGRPRLSWKEPVQVVLFAAAYCLLARVSYAASFTSQGYLAAWWAPSGLALAALVRAQKRRRPWYVLGIAVAAAVVNAAQPVGAFAATYRTLADVVEPVTGAWLLRRYFGRQIGLQSHREVLGFALIGGLLGPALGAAVVFLGGALAPATTGAATLGTYPILWWSSAVLGAILFAPVLLTWRTPRRFVRGRRLLEATLLACALLLVTVGDYFLRDQSPLSVLTGFAAFPVLAWAAVRFGPTGAARSAVSLSLLSASPYFTALQAPAPFVVLMMQGVYALAAVTSLALSALTLEAKRLHVRAESQANRAEESLALLESALRGAPFGMAFFDASLRLTRLNAVFASLCERRVAELAGRTVEEALPDVGAKLRPQLEEVLARGRVREADLEIPGDPPRSWLATAFPVWARAGRPAGVGLLMLDVTDQRAAERERSRLYGEMQEAVRVREDFLSIASHELKTPLTPLAARLSHIQRRLAGGESLPPEEIEKPLKSLRQLTELINDLLDASRIEHGRLMLHPEPQPLGELVRAAAEPFRGASPRHKVVVHAPSEPLWVSADRQRLSQVFTNLVDNAIKYSPGGGTVEVSVRPHPEGVEVTVSDEGIGIPQEQLNRLFERYYRAANATVSSYGGLGLGLYITRDIVDRHGGRIWAESAPGKGSTFHVLLPRLRHAELQQALH